MVKPLLRELAGPFPPFFHFEEPWFRYERGLRPLIDAWDHLCQRAIRDGSAEELHATREDYQTLLLAHLKILDGQGLLFEMFAGEYPSEFARQVARNRDLLQKHYDSLFPRWQTIEDLEAILLERISLPNEQLKALAAKYPAPAAWYNESDEPAAKE